MRKRRVEILYLCKLLLPFLVVENVNPDVLLVFVVYGKVAERKKSSDIRGVRPIEKRGRIAVVLE